MHTNTYMHTYILYTYILHTYIAYTHTTYIHTYIHTDMHTYITYKYIHTYGLNEFLKPCIVQLSILSDNAWLCTMNNIKSVLQPIAHQRV